VKILLALLGVIVATGVVAQDRVIKREDLRSGVSFAGNDVRALQNDDFQNPAMLWVERGARLWREPAGSKGEACAGCHQEPRTTMKGVATRFPKFDTKLGRLLNLEGRINACRVGEQGAQALAYESEAMLSLAALVAHQSRGMPHAVSIEGPARPAFEAGEALFRRRIGQMNLACTHCHEANWGRKLLAESISQGHPSAYPIYRLEWQTVGSLHRRFRSCLSGVRAEMWPYGAEQYLQLELYLAWRAEGLPIETPGVRR
jgi:L-cysteine S-thiosulfotransferase